jgi:hypothetical protein
MTKAGVKVMREFFCEMLEGKPHKGYSVLAEYMINKIEEPGCFSKENRDNFKGVNGYGCTCFNCSQGFEEFNYSKIVPRYLPRVGQLIMVRDRDREYNIWFGPFKFHSFDIIAFDDPEIVYVKTKHNGYWKFWRHLTGHEQLAWKHIE